MKFKLIENFQTTREEALELRKTSSAYAVLYGYRRKNSNPVWFEPEEHTEESLRSRIDAIVNDYTVYGSNPKGNRYSYEHDFLFYILYGKPAVIKQSNSVESEVAVTDAPTHNS